MTEENEEFLQYCWNNLHKEERENVLMVYGKMLPGEALYASRVPLVGELDRDVRERLKEFCRPAFGLTYEKFKEIRKVPPFRLKKVDVPAFTPELARSLPMEFLLLMKDVASEAEKRGLVVKEREIEIVNREIERRLEKG